MKIIPRLWFIKKIKKMKNHKQKTGTQAYSICAGSHLKSAIKATSFGGLFLSLLGTGLIWAGSEAFNCPAAVWETCLIFNLSVSAASWIAYLPFRNTDRLLGNGILALFMLFSMFWLFGFSMFYFYFIFAPMELWIRLIALGGFTTALLHRAFLIFSDIKSTFKNNGNLFNRMYCDEGDTITFTREAVGYLEKARPDRNPFKSFHLYAAMFLMPFVFILNRILTPIIGDGNGVFIVTSFFAVPIVLWGAGIFVQTIIIMIYYPIKINKQTGKVVLLKDW